MHSHQETAPDEMTKENLDRPGIQSVEVAAVILKAMTATPGSMTLKDLAAASGMAPAKAHRYLVSLTRTGLVEQDPASGRYAVGPLSLALGLAALGDIDVVRVATAAMPALRDAIDETVVLTVWGNRGATIVRFEESSQPVTLNVRVGNVLPLLTTALGKIYAAFLDTKEVHEAVETERRAMRSDAPARKDLEAMLADVRHHGLARISGELLAGVGAMAAPIFDHEGRLAASMGVVGRQAALDVAWGGAVAGALRDTTAQVSRRLGHSG